MMTVINCRPRREMSPHEADLETIRLLRRDIAALDSRMNRLGTAKSRKQSKLRTLEAKRALDGSAIQAPPMSACG